MCVFLSKLVSLHLFSGLIGILDFQIVFYNFFVLCLLSIFQLFNVTFSLPVMETDNASVASVYVTLTTKATNAKIVRYVLCSIWGHEISPVDLKESERGTLFWHCPSEFFFPGYVSATTNKISMKLCGNIQYQKEMHISFACFGSTLQHIHFVVMALD